LIRHAWLFLLSLYFPLCATEGAAGIKPPGVVDFSHFQRNKYSNVLAAPAGFQPAPDMITPVYNVPAPVLFAAIQQVAAAEGHIYNLDTEPQALQAAWIIRSHFCNFPDIVEVAAIPDGPNKSTLIFYTHALYGWYAYGVTNHRAKTWLAALTLKVMH
jgi:hypothetical protein